MSKYVILTKFDEPLTLGGGRYQEYSLFCHTNTKYPDNKPYFSSDMRSTKIDYYAIEKENLDELFKVAQQKRNHNKVFILKINSPKLKQILDEVKASSSI